MAQTETDTISSPVRRKRGSKISVLNEEFDLSLFVLIARKRWKLLLGIFLLAIVCAGLYLRYAQRVYEENCIVQVNSQNTANKLLSPGTNLYGSDDEVAQSVELMRSPIFLGKVFRLLPMDISYYTEGTFKNYEKYLTNPYKAEVDSIAKGTLVNIPIYVHFSAANEGKITLTKGRGAKNSYPFTTGKWCETPYGKIKIIVFNVPEITKSVKYYNKDADFFKINDYNDLTRYYANKITVKEINAEAKTVQISCLDEDDTKAADIVNTIGDKFKDEVLKKRQESDNHILGFVNEQLDTIYNRIRETEKILGDTNKKSGKVESRQLVDANTQMFEKLEEMIQGLELNKNILSQVEHKINSTENISSTDLIAQLGLVDEAGQGLRDNLDILRSDINARQSALMDATLSNLKVQQLDTLIKEQKNIIFKSINFLQQKFDMTENEYKLKADEIQSKFLSPSVVQNIENIRLSRETTIDQKYYDLFLEKKAEYAISKAGYVPETDILQTAIPVWIPVSPRKTATVLIALLIAIVLSVLILVIIYMFYNNITSVYEIEKLIESPITILGIIPKYDKEIPASQIIVNHNPKSILAESFRSIRTNLQFISNETEAKIISVTSTVSGEGKTFVCVNLAGIIAYSGKKVIVLDLDMRRPRIHTAFGMDNSKGMSTLLIGKYKAEEVIQKTENENLDIITAGPIPPNPSELVISKTMDEVLDKLKGLYDIIIVDNPPVGLVTDGIAMLRRADYPIYLMRVDYSKREFIYFVDRLYYENQFHKLSIILNGVDFKRQKYSYSYYKYGYYGYGYGYGYTYGHGNYYET